MLYYIIYNNYSTPEQAVLLFIISLAVFIFSIVLHELAHGITAYKMGDDTAKVAGRLTLNPFKHLTISGFIMFIFLGVGWAKPVPINPLKFKKYRKGIRLVSISGVLTNIVLGLLSAGLYALLISTVGVPNMAMQYVYFALSSTMLVNSFLAMFNILPIYPLDGFNFVTSFMKSNNKFIHYVIKNGFKIVLGILIGSLIFELFFNIDLISYYLSLLYDWVFVPIANLGV